jgi:hypothetical protein
MSKVNGRYHGRPSGQPHSRAEGLRVIREETVSISCGAGLGGRGRGRDGGGLAVQEEGGCAEEDGVHLEEEYEGLAG